jgi:hypothetical protein
MTLLAAETAAPTAPAEAPLISFDTWGLIVIGALVLVLWLAFRRMFPQDPPASGKPPGTK